MRRREFIGGAFGWMLLSGCTTPCLGRKMWYRGVLHCHTLWSNGRAFPEEAVEWYRDRGYNFLGLSDHNVFQDDPAKWVSPDQRFGWQTPTEDQVERYLKAHPAAETRADENGALQIRLKTYRELRAQYEVPGAFALLPAMEMTHATMVTPQERRDVHMNVINIPGVPDAYRRHGVWPPYQGKTARELIAEKYDEARRLAESKGVARHMFVLNHPIWQWYDVTPEDLVANPQIRFFEVCNNGSMLGAAAELPDDGLDTDRFWDAVNAFRARRGQPLLYGIGNDDTHFYFGEKEFPMLMPGNAWSYVRAASPAADDILAAMEAGDFAACEGLEPEDVSFDRGKGVLTVSVGAEPSLVRKVTFIVSKRGFDERPVRTLTIRHPKRPQACARTIRIYSDDVGKVVKTVVGAPGEPLTATYEMAEDDLYVRARIESPKPPLCRVPMHPKQICCWTQPYIR